MSTLIDIAAQIAAVCAEADDLRGQEIRAPGSEVLVGIDSRAQ